MHVWKVESDNNCHGYVFITEDRDTASIIEKFNNYCLDKYGANYNDYIVSVEYIGESINNFLA